MPAASGTPRKALFLLALLTLLWGTNWSLFRVALAEMSVWSFRVFVVVVASAGLFAAVRLRGESLGVPPGRWRALLTASVCNITIWNMATALAVVYLPSGQSSVLAYSMPLWLAVLSAAFLGQRFTPRLLAALALGVGAVALLMAPNFGVYAGAPAGLVAGLGAGLAWAVGTIVVKRTDWGGMGLSLTAWQMLLSLPPIFAGYLIFDGAWPTPGLGAIAVSIYIALIPMSIGTATWFAIVGLLPAQVAGLSSVSVPIVAMVSGAIAFGEPLGPVQLAALACSASSLWLALTPPRAAAKG